MKNFKDLVFKNHPAAPHFSTQAEMKFDNNYGVSVITGQGAYTSESSPYEIAITYKGELCYSTDITDDVIGYQNEGDVSDVMKRVQELKE